MTERDLEHLRRCVQLAREAVEAGDEPFGSVLVDASGRAVAEDRNRTAAMRDLTRHPELELAQRATQLLSAEERAGATVYTSGEHCVMCSAATGWAGVGRIVYATSSAQMQAWAAEWGLPDPPVRPFTIGEVVPGIVVEGPADELVAEIRALHERTLDR